MASIIHWRVWCATDARWESWYLPADAGAPSSCPVDTGHSIDTAKTVQVGSSLDVVRTHPEDGSIITKADPGLPETDPKYTPKQFATSATQPGLEWFDLAPSGVRLQEVILQIRNGTYGDTVEIAFLSDGTDVSTFGPTNTKIKTFGSINIPLHRDALGWSVRVREPLKVGTSVFIPPGLKAALGYTSSNVASQDIAADVVTQE